MSFESGSGMIGRRQQMAARIRAELESRVRERSAAGRSQTVKASLPAAQEIESPNGCGPTGEGEFVVGEGDCLSSIASSSGYFWETIWNDPANAALRSARGNPNALLPGDRVTLPARSMKLGSGVTEMRHRFVRRGEPTWLVLKLLDESGDPRPNLAYTLIVDGDERAGITDGDGRLREPISGRAAQAVLRIDGEQREQYALKLGRLDPAQAVSGMQARLNNLGYACGPVDGKMGPRTMAALNRFRADVGLPTSQSVDHATQERLEEHHDQMVHIHRRDTSAGNDYLTEEQWVRSPDQD